MDPVSGEVRPANVAIEHGRITAVGADVDGDESIDCSELTLVPGLIDCHAHMAFEGDPDPTRTTPNHRLLGALPALQKTLELGVTTVRDAWGADAGLRDAIAAGHVTGPRLLISLAQLCGTAGIGDHFGLGIGELDAYLGTPWLPRGNFDGPYEARRAVRRMVRAEADVIKVAVSGSATQPRSASAQQVADDELAEIVAEAARHGRHVMAHAHGARTAEAAARAGVRSVEHGFFLDEPAVAAMVEHGTWLVPTLSAALAEPLTDESPDWLFAAVDGATTSFKLALDAGVRIAMGTDCPASPHEGRLGELRIMEQLGMSATAVWRAATSDAAELLDRDDLGRIQPGRIADIVALRGDPMSFEMLEDRIEGVWKDGQRVVS